MAGAGAGAGVAAGSTGRAATPACALPHQGQNFTARGKARPHAALTQRYSKAYSGSGMSSTGSGIAAANSGASSGIAPALCHWSTCGTQRMFHAFVAAVTSPKASC